MACEVVTASSALAEEDSDEADAEDARLREILGLVPEEVALLKLELLQLQLWLARL